MDEATDDTTLPGLVLDQVEHWLEDEVGLRPPVRAELISGGRSNLTYRIVAADGRTVALRRPPAGQLLQTAHDMTREWTVLRALRDTAVPVADPLALCTDDGVTGAPFYVMGWVDGVVPADPIAVGRLGAPARRTLTDDLADVLATLHSLDADEVGLSGWRRPGGYLQRQLSRWHRQIHASGCHDLDLADRVHASLVRRAPEGEQRVVHGDYRAGNVMVGTDGRILAVLDWELATIGDPLADVAWLLASWSRPGDEFPPATLSPTTAEGFGSRDDLVDRYASRSTIHLDALPLYEAFARWRSACITAGVRARYVAGAMGAAASQAEVEELDLRLRQQLLAAEQLLSRS